MPWVVPFLSKKESGVAQSCLILCDPMDCSLPGSSVHGIFQARVLEWVAISFSRGSSRPRDRTQVSIVGFTLWATREVTALITVVVVQLLSQVQLFVTLWMAACQASLSFMISQSLLKFMTIESVMPSNHLFLCRPLLLLPSIFPRSGTFPVSHLFASGGESIGASASVLSVNIWGWFPLGLTGLVSLLSKGLSRVFSSTAILKHQFFGAQPSLWSTSHIHTWLHDYYSFIKHFDVGTHKPMTLLFFHFGLVLLRLLPSQRNF